MSRGVPPLAERSRPGLSETLTGPKHPEQCQSCGHAGTRRWIECDAWDLQTRTVVVLCDRCSSRLIEPHARLYVELQDNAPWPGAMALCGDCAHRDGVTCRCPVAKRNGGRGMAITHAEPVTYHWSGQAKNGRRTGGFRSMYNAPPSACEGHSPIEATP